MKKIFSLILFFLAMKGFLMATELKAININGVEVPVIFEKSAQLPLFNIQAIFKGAGSASNGKLLGLSDVTSSMLNEGTKKLGATKFAQKLEERAISLSVGSTYETMNFAISGMKNEQNLALKALSDLLKDPNFTQKTWEKIQESSISALLEKESNFDYQAQMNLNKHLFKDSAMENPMGGTLESLKKISLKDIENFYKNTVNLNSLILVIGGDVDFVALQKTLKDTFSNLPLGKKVEIAQVKVSDKEENVRIIKDTKQAYVYFGAPFFVKDFQKENAKIKVASFVLGAGGFGSRILEEIRVKRGLAYSAMMYLSSQNSKSLAQGFLQTSLENEKEATKLVKEVVDKFLQKGITQKELDEAKKYLLGSEPLRNETLNQRLNTAFGNYYRGLPLDFDKIVLDEVAKLSLKEVNDYIKSHKEIKKLTFSIVSDK